MEYLFELIFELVIGGGIEASKNRKIPKYIRYPLIIIISLFFITVIGLVFFAGVISLKENIFLGIFFMLIALFMLIMSIIKFRKTYLNKIKKS